MRQKTFYPTAILITILCIVYCSCSKDQCKGVVCFNGGICSKGACTCPNGYTGPDCRGLATTEIDYYNNTFTPVNMSVSGNGDNTIIPVGGHVAVMGTFGSLAEGGASTFETTSSGTQVGLRLTWKLRDTFPATVKTVYINVPPAYFFLKIANTSSYNIWQVYVNYRNAAQTLDYVLIPNTGKTYDVGYYSAVSNSDLYLIADNNRKSWTGNINLLFTQNQSYTYMATN